MAYEFKVEVITQRDSSFLPENLDPLQKLFDQGWEYVDNITQPISSSGGTYSNNLKSQIAVVLKREKSDLI
jgi:hypothetical protein